MHLSFKVRRFLPAVLSAALLLSTANAGIGYAENSAAAREEVFTIISGNLTDEYQLKITRESEDYTIELYCMNNELHWPDADDAYKIGYKDLSKYPGLEDKLIKALYAGYPYNGMKLYSDATTPIDEETFNSFLVVPDKFRGIIDQDTKTSILGDEQFSYQDYLNNNEDHYNRLKKITDLAKTLENDGKTTNNGLSASDITQSAFYLAAYAMVHYKNFNDITPLMYWNNITIYQNDWKEAAHSATQNAIWMILQKAGVEKNEKGVRYDELAQKIYNAANSDQLKYLNEEPDQEDVTVTPEAQNVAYDKKLAKWIAGPYRITENLTMYGEYTVENNNYTVMVKDAEGNFETVTGAPVDKNFYLASNDENHL